MDNTWKEELKKMLRIDWPIGHNWVSDLDCPSGDDSVARLVDCSDNTAGILPCIGLWSVDLCSRTHMPVPSPGTLQVLQAIGTEGSRVLYSYRTPLEREVIV